MPDLAFPLRSAFIALPLEGPAKWQFQAVQEALKPFKEFLRFQQPNTPHLTLQFWPELMEIEYAGMRKQAEKVARSTAPFTLRVTEVGTFGDRGDVRVLFLSVAFSEELARLKKSCPWVSGRKFEPHITLARVDHPQRFSVHSKRIMKAVADTSFDIPVDRLRFYAEVNGCKQTPIQDFVFGVL